MDADSGELRDSELTDGVIGAFYAVYRELGHGFLEAVYENSMVLALRDAGVGVLQQVPIDVYFRGHRVGEYRADLMIPGRLLIEVKAAEALVPAHETQLLNYLKATGIPIGLLFNFGPKPRFSRLILDSAGVVRGLRMTRMTRLDADHTDEHGSHG
jgi:GxxExxY protein